MRRIFLGLMLLLFYAAAYGAPSVSWDDSKLTVNAYPGQTDTYKVELQFSVASDVATIEVTPNFRRLITVSPARLIGVQPGDVYSVEVTIEFPIGHDSGLYDGAIQVRERRKVLAKPLPVIVNLITDPLQAIDSDADGIWDDIQAWIDANHQPGTATYLAIRQVARALQQALLNSESEDASIRIAENDMTLGTQCLYFLEGNESINTLNTLQAYVLRTEPRTQAYLIFESHLGGQVFRDNRLTEASQVCEE